MIDWIDPNRCVFHKVDIVKVKLFVDHYEKWSHSLPIKVIKRDHFYFVVDGNHRASACLVTDRKVLANIVEYDDASDEEISLIGQRFGRAIHV